MQVVRGLMALGIVWALSTVAAASDPTTLTGVEVRGRGKRAEIILKGEFDIPSYAVRGREDGRRIVVDVANARLLEPVVRQSGHTDLVVSSTASTTARGVRVELSLAQQVTYRARVVPEGIVVLLESLAAEPEPASVETPVRMGHPRIRDLRIERRDGRERVVIDLDQAAEFRVLPGHLGPARLSIRGASLPVPSRRRVEGDDLSVVREVSVKRLGDRAIVEVERAAGSAGTAIREGHRIVWLFSAAGAVQGPPASKTVAREQDLTSDVDSDQVASFLSGLPMQTAASSGSRQYTGRRIDLDFKDADIHNILRLLSEVGGVNVITGDDVSGSVTIRMRNVPWDQALDVILQAKGLGMIRRGNLLRVAPQAVLEKERELAIARKKQEIELSPMETRLIPVSYATAAALQPRAKELLSERGTVSVDTRTNVLVVRDVAEALDDVEELVRSLDTQTPQVLVEARIVEATSNYLRDVGIQWGGDASWNQAFGNQTGVVFPSNIGIAGGNYGPDTPTQGLSPIAAQSAVPNFAVNLPATVASGVGGALGLTLGSVDGNFNINVRLSAAEASGAVKIISSPRVLTLDNNEASISSGTLIPYSKVSAQGVQTAFQNAQLELRVTPHVTADGAVAMMVHVSRDEPDFTRTGAQGEPTIQKREATTQLLIEDGRTAVIGGIFTRNSGRSLDQVPFFGDIPILGVLFQRRRVTDQRNELLIFLTPRIVNRDQALLSSSKPTPQR